MSNTLKDLTGQKFGKLTVLHKGEPYKTVSGYYKTMWTCQCECGNVVNVDTQKLRKDHTLSCGCPKKENKGRPKNKENLTGQRFHKLTVQKWLEHDERKNPTYTWLCKCDCGNYIQTCASKLKSGHTKSCGCMKAERIGNLNKKYKYTSHRLYSVYKAMLDRCYNPQNPMYKHYGEKGIVVCDSWKNNFDAFAEWAFNNGYDKDAPFQVCTIDRKDNYGNYEPDNCRWITNKEQAQNTTRCRFFEYKGERHNMAEWAEHLGIIYNTIRWDFINRNMSVEDIIKEKNISYPRT